MLVVLQFARLYPLGQRDLPIERKHVDFGPLMPRNTHIENPSRDYTPPSALPGLLGRTGNDKNIIVGPALVSLMDLIIVAAMHVRCEYHSVHVLRGFCVCCAEYISLLFTDLGVLTPAAVSDELIQLYV